MVKQKILANGGIGLCGLLIILFAAAKLFGYTHCSWFAVILMPVLLTISVFFVTLVAMLTIICLILFVVAIFK